MTVEKDVSQSMMQGGIEPGRGSEEFAALHVLADHPSVQSSRRDPAVTLEGCKRIVVIGRTGSGKTTLARELAAALSVPHVELDALYFGPEFSTAPLEVLRERTAAALAGDRWVTDGNKRAVRDIVWPRADTIVWLEYSLTVSLWRLMKRAIWRTSMIKAQAKEKGGKKGMVKQLLAGTRGVLTALLSHMGQRRAKPRAGPENMLARRGFGASERLRDLGDRLTASLAVALVMYDGSWLEVEFSGLLIALLSPVRIGPSDPTAASQPRSRQARAHLNPDSRRFRLASILTLQKCR